MNGQETQQEQKEEKLELVFGTEKLLESAKEPFVGEVIYAKFPCHCEDCEKGATALLDQYQKEAPERLHIHIKPLTVYTEVQFQWWNPTKTRLSRWGALQEQLEKLGIMEQFKTEREKAFMGMVAEWQWVEVAVGVKGEPKLHWLPVKLLTPEEADMVRQQKEASTGESSAGESSASSDDAVGEGAKLD